MAAIMKLRLDLRVHPRFDRPWARDGPTHQSVEARGEPAAHSAQWNVWRPVRHGSRTAVAWAARDSNVRDGPSCLLFHAAKETCRFPATRRRPDRPRSVRGGYVLGRLEWREHQAAAVIYRDRFGSRALRWGAPRTGHSPPKGIAVSEWYRCPARNVFDRQDASLIGQRACWPSGPCRRVAVEAGSTGGWHKYVGAVDDGTPARVVGPRQVRPRSAPARRGCSSFFSTFTRGARRRRG